MHSYDRRVRLLLVVSDHRAAGDALTEYLTRHGFDIVARAANAAEAAAAVRSTPIDVALVDGDLAAGWRTVVRAVSEPLEHNRIAVLQSYWGAAGAAGRQAVRHRRHAPQANRGPLPGRQLRALAA